MRFTHLVALLPIALASAAEDTIVKRSNLGTLMALCDADIPRGTLWISEEKAYTCATITDTDVVATAGEYCISAATASLDGDKDLCASHQDCGDGGFCVELTTWKRVCWRLTWDRRCATVGQ